MPFTNLLYILPLPTHRYILATTVILGMNKMGFIPWEIILVFLVTSSPGLLTEV